MSPRTTRRDGDDSLAPPETAERIVRRLRRREVRPGSALENPVLGRATPAVLRSPAAFDEPAARPRRPIPGDPEIEPSKPLASPSPAVSVAQITDEVLRQLDRKLVATRERMGRI